jgi:hypothetical protein
MVLCCSSSVRWPRIMSRRAASFTQADVARAIRAIKQVDPGPVVVEIAPGGVVRIRRHEAIESKIDDDHEHVDTNVEIDL